MYESIISKQKLISLDEPTHTYTLLNSNLKFSSVTEFISKFFAPFNEEQVAQKLTKLKKYKGKSVSDILQDWEERRHRGTVVHKEIENFILETNSLNYKTKLIDNLDLKSQQGIEFLKKCNIHKSNLIFPEVKVFTEHLKLAGTIDLMIYNKTRNQISLVDWKTNVEIKKTGFKNGTKSPTSAIQDSSFNKYELQLSMYQHILEKYYNATVSGLYIVHLKESGFQYLDCQFQSNIIKEMLLFNE